MQVVLDRSGVEGARAFLDDVTVGGSIDDEDELWSRTLRVLFSIAETGIVINLRKCRFLVTSAVVLGLELEAGGFRIGRKFL